MVFNTASTYFSGEKLLNYSNCCDICHHDGLTQKEMFLVLASNFFFDGQNGWLTGRFPACFSDSNHTHHILSIVQNRLKNREIPEVSQKEL